ncbi:hypothetical protein EV175_005300 [Coemansia sp. RSA 1933]|nr:hypothetical protein EV175_005300 [Coemansia sp. RSA 1933]
MHNQAKSNAIDPASLLAKEEENNRNNGNDMESEIIRNGIGKIIFISRMYRAYCVSLLSFLVIAGMCCLLKSPDMASPPAAVTGVANAVSAPTATSPFSNGDLGGDTEKSHHIDSHHRNPTGDDPGIQIPKIQIKPYKDTGIRLPVLPNYGSPEAARLGCDHVYVIHNLGHPDRLVRMVRLLQLLRISAEFVPVMQPPESLLEAHMAALNRSSAKAPPSLENIIEWHTRHRIYRDMAEQGYRSAMILDDSVDMELNIKTLMRTIHRHIPTDWDMLFPGHCGAFEGTQPRPSPDALPSLRLANMPICLHAHAISRQGLMHLLHSLPPLPTSNEIIGMAIMRLKEKGLLKMYSVDTPIFTPRPAEQQGTREGKHLAGNKKLDISAVDHLALWQGQTKQRHQQQTH